MGGWTLSGQGCSWWRCVEGEVGGVLGHVWKTFSGKMDVSMTGVGVIYCAGTSYSDLETGGQSDIH